MVVFVTRTLDIRSDPGIWFIMTPAGSKQM